MNPHQVIRAPKSCTGKPVCQTDDITETMETPPGCWLLGRIISMSISEKRWPDSGISGLISRYSRAGLDILHSCETVLNGWYSEYDPLITVHIWQPSSLSFTNNTVRKEIWGSCGAAEYLKLSQFPSPVLRLIYCCTTRLTSSTRGVFSVDETWWQSAPEAVPHSNRLTTVTFMDWFNRMNNDFVLSGRHMTARSDRMYLNIGTDVIIYTQIRDSISCLCLSVCPCPPHIIPHN